MCIAMDANALRSPHTLQTPRGVEPSGRAIVHLCTQDCSGTMSPRSVVGSESRLSSAVRLHIGGVRKVCSVETLRSRTGYGRSRSAHSDVRRGRFPKLSGARMGVNTMKRPSKKRGVSSQRLCGAVVGKGGLEPPRLAAHDPKSCSSTNSDTSPESGDSSRLYHQLGCDRMQSRWAEIRGPVSPSS